MSLTLADVQGNGLFTLYGAIFNLIEFCKLGMQMDTVTVRKENDVLAIGI